MMLAPDAVIEDLLLVEYETGNVRAKVYGRDLNPHAGVAYAVTYSIMGDSLSVWKGSDVLCHLPRNWVLV
jgi:hypothetical protein